MTQSPEQKKQNDSDARIIATTAVKTLYWLIVSLALVFTFIRICFPAFAMNLYADLGNVPRAYDCAKSAVKLSRGEEKVNARISCVNYSIELFAEMGAEYAGEVVDNTFIFLTDEGCKNRTPLIDEYNRSKAAKSFRPNLYSYSAYLHAENARANYALGKFELLKYGKYVAANTLLDSEMTLSERAVLFGQLSAVLEELVKDGKTECGFVETSKLTAAVKSYGAEVIAKMQETPTLYDLYLLKACEKLSARLSAGKFTDETFSFEYKGTTYEVGALYSDLLNEYCK